VAGRFFLVAVRLRVAATDGSLAQRFHMGEEVIAGLLAQDFAKQGAKRTHIAAQRSFFQVTGIGFEFG
jgi:hypothetical protein